MSYVSDAELKFLKTELDARFYAITQTLCAHTPTTRTEGAGKGHWVDPEKVRILESTATQRKLAVADFAAILQRIVAIK